MINNPLSEIVKLTITISNPAVNTASFDSILLVAAPPTTTGKNSTAKSFAVTNVDDLDDYGYKTTDPLYIALTAIKSQANAPGSVWVVVRQKDGETDSDEDIATTLSRAADECDFYGVNLTSYQTVQTDVASALAWVESHNKLMGLTFVDYSANPVKTFTYDRTFQMYGGDADAEVQPEVNAYEAAGLMAHCFAYTPGSETWALKELSSFVPSRLSATQKSELEENNITTYRRYAGQNITMGGKTLNGQWIDVIRFKDWLESEVSTNVFNALKSGPKTPYTDDGIALVETAVKDALSKGQKNGGIAPDEMDSNGVKTPGFTVTVPKALDLTEAQRKSRVLPDVKFTARLAGAIHSVTIDGTITF